MDRPRPPAAPATTASPRSAEERELWLRFRLALLLNRDVSWPTKFSVAAVAQRRAFLESSRADATPSAASAGTLRFEKALTAALEKLPKSVARQLQRAVERPHRQVDREIERALDLEADLIVPEDPDYPARLFDLQQPPILLYARRPPLAARRNCLRAIGIVGPRNADPYGLETARSFAGEFAAAGVCVVSGFARGVDIASHRATYDLGTTWALLGCGVDIDYPRRHHRDADRIVEHGGCVLSEFPLGEEPQRWHFPLRNRLIAALGDALLVVQAGERSGSLITAHAALELGRDVWAVPGRIDHTRSKGANQLIRDGAGVALQPTDLLETLTSHFPPGAGSDVTVEAPDHLGPVARQVLEHLRDGPCSLESLHLAIGQPIATLFAALGELELSGTVDRRTDGTFARLRQR